MKRYKPNQQFSSTVKTKVKKSTNEIGLVNPDSAGIDIGSRSHFVAVPDDRDQSHVREFSTTTSSLLEMIDWLKKCKIKTVAMESTGSYWIPAYELLESHGFEVYLVNAHFIKNVPGRKTDVIDCQWIQKLHSFGLLSKSFRPKDHCLKLRALVRQHTSLILHRSPHVQHMQKALQEMNIQLHTHIRDITGLTGMRIINAILAGERDIKVFASLVHPCCKKSAEEIAESLRGNYREEHLFILKQAKDLYEYYTEKIIEAEQKIEMALKELSKHTELKEEECLPVEMKKGSEFKGVKKKKKGLSFEAGAFLKGISGTDLTQIPGIDQTLALKIMAELGGSVEAWQSEKHFASWLGLCPGNKISGGRQISGKTKPCANRLAICLRMAANALWNGKCYLGSYLRRMKIRLGGMKAVTATAHKMAIIIYFMIRDGVGYRELGDDYYERTYQERRLTALRRQVKEMGLELVSVDA
jgi:transposase